MLGCRKVGATDRRDDVAQKQASLRPCAIAIDSVGTGWCYTTIKLRKLAAAGDDWPMAQIMGVVVMSSAADGWYTSHSLLGFHFARSQAAW